MAELLTALTILLSRQRNCIEAIYMQDEPSTTPTALGRGSASLLASITLQLPSLPPPGLLCISTFSLLIFLWR